MLAIRLWIVSKRISITILLFLSLSDTREIVVVVFDKVSINLFDESENLVNRNFYWLWRYVEIYWTCTEIVHYSIFGDCLRQSFHLSRCSLRELIDQNDQKSSWRSFFNDFSTMIRLVLFVWSRTKKKKSTSLYQDRNWILNQIFRFQKRNITLQRNISVEYEFYRKFLPRTTKEIDSLWSSSSIEFDLFSSKHSLSSISSLLLVLRKFVSNS